MEKRKELLCKEVFVTPVYEKEYFFNSIAELPKCLNQFDEQIKQKMDEDYLDLIRELCNIQPEIDLRKLQKLEQDAKQWGKHAQENIRYYKTIWHM